MTVEFKFAPLEYVKIVAYHLGFEGRVLACEIRPGGVRAYEVEFASDCKIDKRLFYEDELVAREVK